MDVVFPTDGPLHWNRSVLQRFNAEAARLKLLTPGGAPGSRARGVAYEMQVDTFATAAAEIISADLKV